MPAKTHGMSKTRIYIIWKNIKGRCYRETSTHYHRYGGRGITVCDEWRNSFENFYKWAKNSGYNNQLTIDRIDVDGNYCPENCRFISNCENSSRMNYYHIEKETGAQSKECREKIKTTSRNLYGKETILISPENKEFVFISRSEAIDFLVKITGRERSSLKSHLTSCISNKSSTISGWRVK